MDLTILKNITDPIFYVTNDVSHGIGLEEILPNFHIVCLDDHPLVDILQKKGVSVFCLERELLEKNILRRSSGTILEHPRVIEFIEKTSGGKKPNILFFKPQKKIELMSEKYGYNLIGNSTIINNLFEDKLSFFEICKEANLPVPRGEIVDMETADYLYLVEKYGENLVIQTGRGWAGSSTHFIFSKEEFENLKGIYQKTKAKVCQFIPGRTIINNDVVYRNKVLVSKPATQIMASPLLTSAKAGTGGRQWPAGLSGSEEKEIFNLSQAIGEIMSKKGYRGIFGLDFILEDKTNKIYLSECNARLTASTPFFTKLELKAGSFPMLGCHLLSFLNIGDNIEAYVPADVNGGEIIARNTENAPVMVKGEFPTGLYDKNLNYLGESAYLDRSDENAIWIQAVDEGRIVNPEIELIKLDSLINMAETDGELKDEFTLIIGKVKDRLKAELC